MKKCPKCGTILDDSKRKCYMCGADLQRRMGINFGETFDSNIGATVTTSQDNVFNNVNNISANVNDVVSDSNSDVTFSSGKATDLYQNQLNSLNSMQFDERTALEKIFSGDSRFNNKDELVEKDKKLKNKRNSLDGGESNDAVQNNTFNNNNNINNSFSNVTNDFFGKKKDKPEIMPAPVVPMVPPVQPSPPVVNDKPSINWGNNLFGNRNDVSGYKDKVARSSGIRPSTIFNFLCLIIFVGCIFFAYKHFTKEEEPTDVNFGGLTYMIDEKFLLSSDEDTSRLYTYGDSCALRVTFGAVNDSDGFITSYFDNIRKQFEVTDGFHIVNEKLKIKENEWSTLSVGEIKNNAATGGSSMAIRYKYISIVYKGNFYHITFGNVKDDNTCSAMFNSFVETLDFDS